MPKRRHSTQRRDSCGYSADSNSDNSDSEEKQAGAPLPTEHRFITVNHTNHTRPPPTALAVLRQSSRTMRLFKRQKVSRSTVHPSGYIPSGRNVLAASATTMSNLGTNLKDLLSGFGTGLKEVVMKFIDGAVAVTATACAAAPSLAQTTVAVCTLTQLALQNPGNAAALAGIAQVLRRGGLTQAFWANLGYPSA